jgi:hypothetical protein
MILKILLKHIYNRVGQKTIAVKDHILLHPKTDVY